MTAPTYFRADWTDLSPQQCEDLAFYLVKKEHPTLQRLSALGGGDGGRDGQIVLEDGTLHYFEIKYFTGRINRKDPARRSQVERSIKTAVKRASGEISRYTLVCPVDLNDSELKWFTGLQQKHAFVLDYLGLCDLEVLALRNQDVARAYAAGTRERMVQAAHRYDVNPDAIAARGLPSVVDQFEKLRELSDLANPNLGVHPTPSGYRYFVKPNAPDPESLKIRLSSPFGDPMLAASFRRKWHQFEMGEVDEIRFPSSELDGGAIEVFGDVQQVSEAIVSRIKTTVDIGCWIQTGTAPERVPFRLTTIKRTATRTIAEGTALDGALTVRLTVLDLDDQEGEQYSMLVNFQVAFGAVPNAGLLLPALALMRRLREGEHYQIFVEGLPATGPNGMSFHTDDDMKEYVEFEDLVRTLDLVQTAANTYFSPPREFSAVEVNSLRKLAVLFDEKILAHTPWEYSPQDDFRIAFTGEPLDKVQQAFAGLEKCRFKVGNLRVTIGDNDIEVPGVGLYVLLRVRHELEGGAVSVVNDDPMIELEYEGEPMMWIMEREGPFRWLAL